MKPAWPTLGAGVKQVAGTAAALLVERVVRVLVGIIVTALVARHLGPTYFGELSFGLALGAIGAGVAQLGMDSILIREFVRKPGEAGVLIVTSSVMRFAVAALWWLVATSVILLTSRGHPGAPSPAAVAVLGLTAFQAVSSVPSFWLQTHRRAWQATSLLLVVFLAASAGRLVLVSHGGTVVGFGWIAVVETIASGVVTYLQVRRTASGSWGFSRGIAVELLKVSWPMAIAAVVYLGYTRFDQVLLVALAGQDELGIYAAALRLSEQGFLLPAVLATPMLGLISAAKGRTPELERQVERYAAASAVLAYGFVLFVWIAAPLVYQVCFGGDYSRSIGMVRIQVLAAPFIAVGFARNQVLIAEGRTGFALVVVIAGLLGNIALNLLLIPRIGGAGASWAGVAAQVISLYLATWCHRPVRWMAGVQTTALIAPWRAWTRPATAGEAARDEARVSGDAGGHAAAWRRWSTALLAGRGTPVPAGSERYRLVIVKLDRLGDFVLAVSAIRLLVAHHGEEHTLLIVSPVAEPLAAREFPRVRRIVMPASLGHGRAFRAGLRHMRALRSCSAERVVCLRHQRWDYDELVLSWLPAREHLRIEDGFTRRLAPGLRTYEFAGPGCERWSSGTSGGVLCTELEMHRSIVSRALGRKVSDDEIRPQFSAGAPHHGCIAVSPLGSERIRDFPPALLIEAVRAVRARSAAPIVLLGGGPQLALLEGIRSRLMAEGVSDVTCQTALSVGEYADFVAGASLVISTETATAHLAAAYDRPAVLVIGGGHFGRFAPWTTSGRQIWLSNPLECFQCNWACPYPEPYCLTGIAPEDIRRAVNAVLESR